MKAKIFFLSALIFAGHTALAQPPSIEWQKCLGGTGSDFSNFILPAAVADT